MTTRSRILPRPVIAAALALVAAAGTPAHPGDAQAARGPATPTVRTAEPLSASAREAVEEALGDELRGQEIYALVLKDHGEVRPFSTVLGAERRHASFLRALLEVRGLVAPAPTPAEPAPYATVEEACAGAVEYERENAALYDRLLAAGPLPDDVRLAFEHNRAASLDRHRPAFERCAGLGPARGAGRGAGRGFGAGCGRSCGPECGCGCGRPQCGHGLGPRGQAGRG